jgi:hypothetical protein
MVPDFLIPEPIAFNCFKHHQNFIELFLQKEDYITVKQMVLTLNNNYIDLYTGSLSPEEICNEVIQFLHKQDLIEKAGFEAWLAYKGGFTILEFSDKSMWILRLGSEPKRYVHIHPSKTGSFTQRIKGSTLKTFYILLKQYNLYLNLPPLLQVNKIRQEAGLSPVKKWEPGHGFEKAASLFSGRN